MRMTLITNVKIADNFWGKSLGLIMKEKPLRLLIKTRFGIHTFGVKFPIDIVVLDSSFNVKSVRESLQPNRVFFWNPVYDQILELPEGDIGELGIEVGQKLILGSIRKRTKEDS